MAVGKKKMFFLNKKPEKLRISSPSCAPQKSAQKSPNFGEVYGIIAISTLWRCLW
jgi:hypothetical protein